MYKKFSHVSRSGIGTPTSHPLEWTTRSPLGNNETAKEEEDEWHYTNLTVTVTTSTSRYFYFALSNCLPGKKISSIESATGISTNPMYAVENDELVCANRDTFCQGPLKPLRFWLTMMQSSSSSTDQNGIEHLSAEEYSQFVCACILIFLYVPFFLVLMLANYHYRACCLAMKVCREGNDPQRNSRGRLMLVILTVAASMHFLCIILHVVTWDIIMSGQIKNVELKDVSAAHGRMPVYPDSVHHVGDFFGAFAHCLFVFVLILIAKGHAITRSKISATGRMKIAIYLSIYASLQMFVLLWNVFMFDPALVLLEYESPPGIVLLIARVGVTIWFAYACFVTLKKNDAKKLFMTRFFFGVTIWLLTMPVVVLLGVLVIDTMFRQQIYYIVDNVIIFLGIASISMMWLPTVASKLFITTSNVKRRNESQLFGISRGSSLKRNKADTTQRDRELESAIRQAESLQYKLQRMQDDSEDLTNLVNELVRHRPRREVEMATIRSRPR